MPTNTLDKFNIYVFRGYPSPELVATAHTVTPELRAIYAKQPQDTRSIIMALNEEDALRAYNKTMGFATKSRHR